MKSRIDPLEIILEELQPHILILSEHDIKESELDRLKLNKFILSSSYCRKVSSKGGVMILNKEELRCKQVVLPKDMYNCLIQEKQFEFCLGNFTIGNFKFLLVGLYRSPSSSAEIFLDKLSQLLGYLSKTHSNIICAGDININVLEQTKEKSMLRDMLAGHNMKFMINFPTRVTSNSETAIDNFLINKQIMGIASVQGVITCLSDHDGQILELSIPKCKVHRHGFTIVEKRHFSPENMKLFSKLLARETWLEVYFSPVEQKYEIFNQLLIFYFDQAFPKKIVKKRFKKNSWITRELKEQKSKLIQDSKSMRKSKDPVIRQTLKMSLSNYKKSE